MQVQYISHYLSDNDVANFARQSFNKRAEDYSESQNKSSFNTSLEEFLVKIGKP